ncbi:hypothetical protein ACN42_g6003 [Penicillium freii]|uniref:Uncharacterized protein n=1 Tax=Penicillium freii TaxID=48697 RepID=A0A101MIE4_PENFR|nr:hypothetical protein ACN42_g6003 [Penicillium freii]
MKFIETKSDVNLSYFRRNFVLELLILLLILLLMLLRHIGAAAIPPLVNRHRFLFFPLSPFLPQSILTPFAFVGLFAFLFVVWTSPGLDISFSVTVKHSLWNGCAAHSSLIHAN